MEHGRQYYFTPGGALSAQVAPYSGSYPSKAAYNSFFFGSIKFAPCRRIWRSWAPLRCKIFSWLAVKKQSWMANQLSKYSLTTFCLLCDQVEEIIQHILVSCTFARQVWTLVLQKLELAAIAPGIEYASCLSLVFSLLFLLS